MPGNVILFPREPVPSFLVDRERGVVTWAANGLRLVHAPQFRALASLFAENGWRRHLKALEAAELAVSEVVVRDMLRQAVRVSLEAVEENG